MKTTLTLKEMGIPKIGYFTKKWNQINEFKWWKHNPQLKQVRIADLIGTQDHVEIKGLLTAELSDYIFVVSIAGKLYIRDGHHRVVVTKLNGNKYILALVVELEP